MRILHLIHSEGIYGAERILLYLASEQQRAGHAPFIGSIRDPGTAQTPFEAVAEAWHLPVVPIRIAPRPTPGVIRTLLRTIRQIEPDVLHSHGYKANILLGPWGRHIRGPMVATLHGWTGGRPFSALWLYELLDRWALRKMDAVILVTRQMLALRALRGVKSTRCHVIENGMPPLQVRLSRLGDAPLPEELLHFLGRRPSILAIGRLSAEKGFNILIEAFADARRQGDHPHQLLIVGEGPERQRLADRITAIGLSDVVRLAGYLDGADRLLSRASGFVMASLTEGMPLALLEAMQWRVPILATTVGAVPELLEGGRRGRLVAPNDVKALAEQLHAMMSSNSDDDDRINAAYEAVTGHFTSERMSRDYLLAYQALLGDVHSNGDARLPAAPP